MRDFAVLPNLVVGRRSRRQEFGDFPCRLARRDVRRRRERKRRRHHVAVDIAARAERRTELRVDRRDDRPEIGFAHAVQLQAAAGRDADAAVTVRVRQAIDAQVKCARQEASRILRSNHERVVAAAQTLFAPRFAGVAIVLLIHAVKLEQGNRFVAELIGRRL
jgi:hypothetical protein